MIYFLLVDRFANGDPSNDGRVDLADPQAFHGGDLAGVTQKLDYLAELGVDTVWMGPIAAMRDEPFYGHGAFHGYWTEALGLVEPRFGTEQELGTLRQAAAARNVSIVLDMVYNHVAPEHAWVSARPDWFHRRGPIRDWGDPTEAQTHDVHGLPDLDQDNPAVYAWLRDTSLSWLARVGPMGFRLDAVRHLDVSFLRRMGAELRAAAGPGFELWGEVFDGNGKVVADTRDAAGLDATFDFPLHYAMRDVVCDGGPAAAIPAVLDRSRHDAPGRWITFLDNHDTPRITTMCHGEAWRVDLALELLFALRGRPMVTWGTEWGATGAGEPDNRADMRWAPADAAERDGWMSRLVLLRSRAAERRTTPALREGRSRTLAIGLDWFVVERAAGAERRWVVYNGGAAPIEVAGLHVDAHDVVVVDPTALGLRAPVVRSGPVRVRVSGVPPLGPGDTVRLVGGAPELGDWVPGAAPVVPGRVRLDAAVYAYKLAIVRADGRVEWSAAANGFRLGGGGELEVRWAGG